MSDNKFSSQTNFQTKSIFATNLPTSSHMNFRSKSMIKKRIQIPSERSDNEKNEKMELKVADSFAPRRSHSEKKIRKSIERD